MLTLKSNFKEKNINSNDIRKIIKNYEHWQISRIILFCLEDFRDSPYCTLTQLDKQCIDLIRRKIHNQELLDIEYHSSILYWAVQALLDYNAINEGIYFVCKNIVYCYPDEQKRIVQERIFECARLYAYKDYNYKFKKYAKRFNLDDDVDLNVFLDFLTDNYPAALTYSREEFLSNKFAREYLKVIYQ